MLLQVRRRSDAGTEALQEQLTNLENETAGWGGARIGLIYKGPDGKAEGVLAEFDRIHIRRLNFLKPDGSLDDANE